MKAKLNIQKITLILGILTITAGVRAQDDFTREIKKEFSINSNTRLELYNKYGNVDVINHDLSSILFHVVVKVHARDQEKADDLLNMIEIKISQEGDVVRAITEIDEDFSRYFRGFTSEDGGFQINYTVTLPKTMPVYLSNKYGNVFINELTSTSTIDIKYGKLSANKILHDSKEPLTKIYLSYSTGSIQETRWIEADIKYSKLNITESKALAIISKYSKLFVTNGSSIVSESKYDTYEVDKLSNFVTNAAYGHFKINNLSGKLQVDTKYSDVIVDHISSGFEGIKVTNSYGSYKLGIDPSASYKINGYSKYCKIIYPENNARVNRINENNEMKVNGVVGNSESAVAEVSVNSHYGDIRLSN
ncbi:MAG TPA: hypothetical protein VHI78_08050 [Bacteroidales bacterium]|jgi:hypothetical protein|nr:hypothetical protein [Bacteroidales bacterium]